MSAGVAFPADGLTDRNLADLARAFPHHRVETNWDERDNRWAVVRDTKVPLVVMKESGWFIARRDLDEIGRARTLEALLEAI